MNDYRARLLPLIAHWTARGARVAIFGTGSHADHLFAEVPELATAGIVAYLDNNTKIHGQTYRGRRIVPPSWAEGRVDVVLCSSFVNELAMASSLDRLPCKVVLSHTPPALAQPGTGGDGFVYRPDPVAHRIAWPSNGPWEPAALAQAERYLSSTAVLDAVLEQFYPCANPVEADLCRAVVRYVWPGSQVVSVGAREASTAAVLALAAGGTGRVLLVAPRFRVRTVIDTLDAMAPRSEWRLAVAAGDSAAISTGAALPIEVVPEPRQASSPRGALASDRAVRLCRGLRATGGAAQVVHVDDPAASARVALALLATTRRARPTFLLSLAVAPDSRPEIATLLAALEARDYTCRAVGTDGEPASTNAVLAGTGSLTLLGVNARRTRSVL